MTAVDTDAAHGFCRSAFPGVDWRVTAFAGIGLYGLRGIMPDGEAVFSACPIGEPEAVFVAAEAIVFSWATRRVMG